MTVCMKKGCDKHGYQVFDTCLDLVLCPHCNVLMNKELANTIFVMEQAEFLYDMIRDNSRIDLTRDELKAISDQHAKSRALLKEQQIKWLDHELD